MNNVGNYLGPYAVYYIKLEKPHTKLTHQLVSFETTTCRRTSSTPGLGFRGLGFRV